jgi:opacity protein-like surface antigen
MKKLFTILTVVALSTTISFAQAQFGATAGLNMSNVVGDGESLGMKMGMHIGASASIPFSDAMSLKTGALYSMKGASDSEGGADLTWSLSYIEIPLNLSFAVSDQMSLMAGPYVGILMGANMKLEVDGTTILEQDGTDGMAAMDIGINLGAGFAVTDAISINAGYQMGLTSLDEEGDGDAKNSNIHIGMTYSFGGGY